MRLYHLITAAMIANGLAFIAPDTAEAGNAKNEDVYCYEVVGMDVDIICDFVTDLQAECNLVDPTNVSQECKDVNSAKIKKPRMRFKASSSIQTNGG